MDITEVKKNLNKKVTYINDNAGINKEYLLTACIIRKNEKGFYYQVELQEEKASCIMIAKLEDIKEIES